MNEITDEILMTRYQGGDIAAFNELYRRHKGRVYAYLRKRLKDDETIDELFQSVFTKFHRSRHGYSDQYPVLKWLYTICRSELLDYVKRQKTIEIETPASPHSVESPVDLAAEKSLSDRERTAVELRYYEDNDFLDIAQKLKTSESNVRKIISRAIAKLRSKYRKSAHESN